MIISCIEKKESGEKTLRTSASSAGEINPLTNEVMKNEEEEEI